MTVKTDVSFRIAGPSLALLLRDCECSESDQVGFLIGEKSSITTQTVSDDEMDGEKIETTITINGTFPVGLPFIFCSPLGRVDESALKEILGSLEKDVVGWYSSRRNSNHRPSLREILLHRELRRIVKSMHPQYFLFCLLTMTSSDRSATHSHKFTFFSLNQRRFQPMSVDQTNLGEAEDNVYRRCTVVDDSFKHLQEVLRSVNGLNNSKVAMTTLHTQVNKHVAALQTHVSKLQCDLDVYLPKSSSSNHNFTVSDQNSSRGDRSTPSTSNKVKPGNLSAEY